jgi:hypothetical protein
VFIWLEMARIGMLVDLDLKVIQYWLDGILQSYVGWIYERSEIDDLPAVTVEMIECVVMK